MEKEEWQELLKKASKDLMRSIEKFGPNEVLDLLVVHSHDDPVAWYLLTRFPTVVAFGEFLSTLPIVKGKYLAGCVLP